MIDAIRDFARSLPPEILDAGAMADTEALSAGFWRAMGQTGLLGIGLPEAYGGRGGPYADIAAAQSALVQNTGSMKLGMRWMVRQLIARFFIAGFGSEAQKSAWLPGLAAGRLTAAVAISEAGAGAHPKHLQTTATADGEDYLLDGDKAYVTNGGLADLFIVFAISAMDGERKRFSAFLVPRGTAGLEVVENAAPPPAPAFGLRLRRCRIPAASLLGEPGTAFDSMAKPFRDMEDCLLTEGMAGGFRHILGRLAAKSDAAPLPDLAAALGELVSLVALLGQGARAAVAALDAGGLEHDEAPALLVGTRVLAAHLLDRVRAYGERAGMGPDRDIDRLLHGIETTLAIARGARFLKQASLGMTLIEQSAKDE